MNRRKDFVAFYEGEAQGLYRLAWFLTLDRDEASELAHEALLRTYTAWRRVGHEDPCAYARRVLFNLVRSSRRRYLVRERNLHRSPLQTPSTADDPAPQVDARLDVLEALKALSPQRRAVIWLRFYDDLSDAAIAETLDRPLGSVKSDIRRALEQMRRIVEPHPAGGR